MYQERLHSNSSNYVNKFVEKMFLICQSEKLQNSIANPSYSVSVK